MKLKLLLLLLLGLFLLNCQKEEQLSYIVEEESLNIIRSINDEVDSKDMNRNVYAEQACVVYQDGVEYCWGKSYTASNGDHRKTGCKCIYYNEGLEKFPLGLSGPEFMDMWNDSIAQKDLIEYGCLERVIE
jgi:hypothetical protein